MKQRKVPLRMCLGCLEKKPKKELIRVVKNNENVISLDRTGKSPGRGAYICINVACLEKAVKGKHFEKAFEIKMEENIFLALSKELEGKHAP